MGNVEFITEEAFSQARAQSEQDPSPPPLVTSIRYDEKRSLLCLAVIGGLELCAPISSICELASLPPKQLNTLRLSFSGTTIILSSADIHISSEGLLSGILGMLPGELIDDRTAPAKKASSAENGRRGA